MSEELNLFLGNANLEALARAHNKLVKVLTGKIKSLESRLSTLETLMKIGQDNDVSLANRIIALENIIACDGIDARLHQPSAKPAETEREWIDVRGSVWVVWSEDDEITQESVFGLGVCRRGHPTHIMPYYPGDKQPEPPKGDK